MINLTRKVVCAAIRNRLGHVICGARHYDTVMHAQIANCANPALWKRGDCEQGFINTWGEFLTRQEAHMVASHNSQIIERCGGDEGKLFSENLY